MNKLPLMLVSLLLVPFLLLAAVDFGWDDDRRQRTLDSEEVAGLRLVFPAFSFQASLARVHSEAGGAVELVWSLRTGKGSPPNTQRDRERSATPSDEASR